MDLNDFYDISNGDAETGTELKFHGIEELSMYDGHLFRQLGLYLVKGIYYVVEQQDTGDKILHQGEDEALALGVYELACSKADEEVEKYLDEQYAE